jgi:hypothetical protein
MNLERLPEVDTLLLSTVQLAFPTVLGTYDGLGKRPYSTLTAGRVALNLTLRNVRDGRGRPTSRHTILLESAQPYKKIVYRERRSGWFAFDRIVSDCIRLLRAGMQEHADQERRRLQRISNENLATYFKARYNLEPPVFVEALISGLELRIIGLPQEKMDSLLGFIKTLNLNPSTSNTTIWDSLQESDDD